MITLLLLCYELSGNCTMISRTSSESCQLLKVSIMSVSYQPSHLTVFFLLYILNWSLVWKKDNYECFLFCPWFGLVGSKDYSFLHIKQRASQMQEKHPLRNALSYYCCLGFIFRWSQVIFHMCMCIKRWKSLMQFLGPSLTVITIIITLRVCVLHRTEP